MDLTYMPGELDYKNGKKVESTIMKREHDSVDDFEHLDPESSPNVHKDFPISLIDSKPVNESEKLTSEEQNVIDPLIKTDESSSFLKSLESVSANNEGSLSHFDLDAHNSEIKIKPAKQSNLLDFEIGGEMSSTTGTDNFQDDSLNSDFITSEIANNKVKTDNESDLLGLVNKAKDTENKDVKDLPAYDDFTKPKEDLVNEPDFGFGKSMKESEALSQYDIKYEKKDIEKKDNQVADDANDIVLDAGMKHEVTKTEKLPKGQEADDMSTEDSFKTDSTVHLVVTPKSEIEKNEDNVKKGPTKDDPFLSDDDLKTYVAVCPSHPESESSLLESKPDLAQPESDVPNAEPVAEDDNESWRNYPSEEDIRSHRVAICPPKPPSVSELDDIIGPEDVFKRIGLVEALVYWRDPKQSGVVFGSIMAILLSLCYMSLISVVAYASLFALTGTVCFRIYKNILQAVQKTSEGHPFKDFLDLELSLPQDKVREITDLAVGYVNAAIAELRRLFLVEDLIDSIKFGVCLWCLTYVGAIFNGMTLVILAFVALFTVPKIYENNKASIDTYIDMGRSKVAEITTKVKAALPIGKKETESKDKEQ